MLYKKQGKYERALDSYQRSLNIKIAQFGEEHPETCATRHNIGEVYVHLNQPTKAQECFNENVILMEKRSQTEKE